MANPPQTLKYKAKCQLIVEQADNRLVGILNPDSGEISGTVFTWDARRSGQPPKATVDLLGIVSNAGSSANLAFVGSNFQGGGPMQFSVVTDLGAFKVNEALAEWTSKQWAVHLVKS